MEENIIPRRARMDQWTPAERSIYDAMQAVEEMPADVRLTNAVNLLHQARDLVADFVDNIPAKEGKNKEIIVSEPLEPIIGKVYYYEGVALRCVERNKEHSCEDCYLLNIPCGHIRCNAAWRSDLREVEFKKVER